MSLLLFRFILSWTNIYVWILSLSHRQFFESLSSRYKTIPITFSTSTCTWLYTHHWSICCWYWICTWPWISVKQLSHLILWIKTFATRTKAFIADCIPSAYKWSIQATRLYITCSTLLNSSRILWFIEDAICWFRGGDTSLFVYEYSLILARDGWYTSYSSYKLSHFCLTFDWSSRNWSSSCYFCYRM